MTRRGRYVVIALAVVAAGVLTARLALPVHTESVLEALFPWAHHLTKEPWLQNPAPTAVTILYETDGPGEGHVKFGTGTRLDQSAPAQLHETVPYGDTTGYLYRARLTGLTPATTYRYHVAHKRDAGGNARSSVATFETWPEAADRVTFIAYGDSRSGAETHRRMARQFDRFHPAFIIHTGDAADYGEVHSDWEPEFFAPLRGVLDRLPVFVARGNHDGTAEDMRRWFDLPGDRTWYSFDCGPVHVVVLDSYEQGADAAEWLAADLAAAKAAWKVVSFHVPVTPCSYYLGQFDRQSLLPLLDKHRVDVVLAGHDHGYERFKPIRLLPNSDHAVTFITTGGGGAPLYPVSQTPAHAVALTAHHFCVLTIEGGKLTLQVFDPDGQSIDRLTIAKDGGRLDPAYVGEARTWEFAAQAVPQFQRPNDAVPGPTGE